MSDVQYPIPHSALGLREAHRATQRPPRLSQFTPFARSSLRMRPIVWVTLTSIWGYQRMWPNAWKRTCIYEPSCSNYAIACVIQLGTIEGLRRAWRRVKRCDGSRFAPGIDCPL